MDRVERGGTPPFRTAFVSPDHSAGVTIDRTPNAPGSPESILGETEQTLRSSFPGYSRLSLRNVSVGRNQGAELTFKTDGREVPPRGVTYLFFVRRDTYVVTGTGPSLDEIQSITNRMVGSLTARS